MTRNRYQTRVSKFFDYAGIPGKTLQQKAINFANEGKNNNNWALSKILKFVYFQRERAERKEISGGTVRNYTKSIKLFCEMADISISWKKIPRGLPEERNLPMTEFPHCQS